MSVRKRAAVVDADIGEIRAVRCQVDKCETVFGVFHQACAGPNHCLSIALDVPGCAKPRPHAFLRWKMGNRRAGPDRQNSGRRERIDRGIEVAEVVVPFPQAPLVLEAQPQVHG